MSLKTIFPDNTETYQSVSAQTMRTLSGVPEVQYDTDFDNSNDVGLLNNRQLSISVSILNDTFAIITLYPTNIDQIISPIVLTSSFPFKSTIPLPAGSFNPNKTTKLGTTMGAILNANLLIFRPCSFTWFIDPQGYVYFTQTYNTMTGSTPTNTNAWSGNFSQGYIYEPIVDCNGSQTDQNGYEDSTLNPNITAFMYTLI